MLITIRAQYHAEILIFELDLHKVDLNRIGRELLCPHHRVGIDWVHLALRPPPMWAVVFHAGRTPLMGPRQPAGRRCGGGGFTPGSGRICGLVGGWR